MPATKQSPIWRLSYGRDTIEPYNLLQQSGVNTKPKVSIQNVRHLQVASAEWHALILVHQNTAMSDAFAMQHIQNFKTST